MKEYRDLDPGNPNRVKFTYDSNGNMTSDYDRNIVTIRYNLLNLPEVIQFGNGNQIINSYDACGRKLSSNYFTLLYNLLTPIAIGEVCQWNYKPGSVDSKGSEYINNFEYTSTMVLVNQQWGSYYTSNYSLTRVKNSEGCVDGLLDYRSSPRYNYYHRDHLGNNCEVWTAPQPTYSGTQPAFVSQRTQYYPGGLPWTEGMGASQQPYKYNDKEFIEMHGYDTYDYMARGMYPASARFTTMDPKCEKYYWISPYAYCADNPVRLIDPDGKDWVDHKRKIIWINNVTSANDKDLQKGDKYLGRNVLVGTHNRDANLKEPINSARFDLYLESNHKGASATIYGNTVPADTKKSGTLAEGLYKAVSGHRNKPQYQNELALRMSNINGTDGLPTVNGNPNPKSDGQTLTGVLFHIGNQHQESLKDSKGYPYSEGCQTSHNGPNAKELHNAFFENIGTNFDGYYYLRGH